MNQDNELNKMFREGLTEPGHHAEYREADWEALEQMLDERQKKRGIIVLLPYIGSVAAVLLIFFAWMFFKPSPANEQVKPSVAVNKKPAAGNANTTATQQSAQAEQQVATNTTASPQNATLQSGTKVDDAQPATNTNGKQNAASSIAGNMTAIAANKHPRKGNSNLIKRPNAVSQAEPPTMIAANKPEQTKPGTEVSSEQPQKNNEAEVAANKTEQNNTATAFSPQTFVLNKPETVKANAGADSVAKAKEKPQVVWSPPKSQGERLGPPKSTHFALTVLAASNVNGVGSFQQSQFGADLGLTFSAGYKRFTLTTGAIYAKTPYATDFSNYHIKYQFSTDPTTVNADCRVLDIPINIDYQLFGNFKNKFSVGTGLSSYLMLKEDYTYTYAAYSTGYAPDGYSTSNRNKHYFGVLNFDVLYQHRLNSKFSLDVQPYLKLPLTEIGYGHVQLQTAGVAVGFSWNIK